MQFSVLIATRNRPELFERAIASVLANRDADFEVIVIDDGTVPPFSEQLDRLEARLVAAEGERVRFYHLPHRERGHGQSYVLNYAVSLALGDYVCFLDDDDYWIDPGHLARAGRIVQRGAARPVDLLFFDQTAFERGIQIDRPIWLEDLGPRLAIEAVPDSEGAYDVSVGQLLTAAGHGHVNTTIVRRAFYAAVDGFDDEIRYECDRDFFLRAIDRAKLIKYAPRVVSRHNVPDPSAGQNMSTIVTKMEKLRFRLSVLEKAADGSRHASIREYARRHKAYTLKHLALAAYAAGDSNQARICAWRGLRDDFNFLWLFFALYISIREHISSSIRRAARQKSLNIGN